MPLFLEPFLKPLSAQEEKSCLDAYQRGDTKARDILVERNLRLVAHVVKKYQGLPDDLISLLVGSDRLVEGNLPCRFLFAPKIHQQLIINTAGGVCGQPVSFFRTKIKDNIFPVFLPDIFPK